MKHKLIKLISLFLALIFVFSLFCIPASALATKRIAGENRYDTSIKIANELKSVLGVKKFDAIVVAYGRNYADALAGSYLAALTSAPILIVNTDKSNENDKASMSLVRNYINKNLSKNGVVYILGGEAVISEEYKASIGKLGAKVIRLAGSNRYETNLAILKECLKYEKSPSDVIICDAYGFADSLSASSLGKPILLVDKQSGKLTKDQTSYLSKLKLENTYIIGGTAAVPESFETELSSYGTSTRIEGINRYQTSEKIGYKFFVYPENAVIAYGHDFPDGLCGGPLAYALEAPLLLVHSDPTNLKYCVFFFTGFTGRNIENNIILGGTNAISEKTVSYINKGEVPDPYQDYRDYEEAQEFIDLLNEYRVSKGLNALKVESFMQEYAMQRAGDLVDDFSHNGSTIDRALTGCPKVTDKYGEMYKYSCGAENIGYTAGYFDPSSTILEAFKNSPGHEANQTRAKWTHVGVGCVEYYGFYYYSVEFYYENDLIFD